MTSKKKTIVEHKMGKGPLQPLENGDIKYYDFSQNNSGGSFLRDDNLAENTIVAARTTKEANRRAEDLGIYFDGCSSGYDCDCCGDRWSSQYSESTDVEPLVYGMRPEEYLKEYSYSMRSSVIVHHADGSRETWSKVEPKE